VNKEKVNMETKNIVQVSLFTESDCNSCESAEQELKQLSEKRKDFDLTIFRRPADDDKFKESNVVICPALFVEDKFVSYGLPEVHKVEHLVENARKIFQNKEQTTIKTKAPKGQGDTK